jgi:SecD/SecF fusion protein
VVELLLTQKTFDQSGKPAVSMQMNGQSKGWEELTGRAYTQNNAVLDNIVYSAPGI